MRLIDADAIYPWYMDAFDFDPNEVRFSMNDIRDNLDNIPTHPTPSNTLGALEPIQTTQLTDEDKETIRIHLNAFKESLCNQGRWYEATEYEELIHRLLSTLSAQPERKNGKWISICNGKQCNCSICGKGYDHTYEFIEEWNFCPNCGSYNGGDSDD